jgi:hypothetical protein
VEIGDEKSAYRFKSDATFHIQIGDQSKLPGSVAKGDNGAFADAKTRLPKEVTSETPKKIEVKPTNPEENPV